MRPRSRTSKSKPSSSKTQIEASDLEIGALAERLHEAEARRDAAQTEALDAEARIEVSKREVARIKDLIELNAASLYRRNSRGNESILDVGDTNDLARRGRYAEAQAARDDKLLRRRDRAQEDLRLRRTEAEQARDAAASEREQINTAKTSLEAARARNRPSSNRSRAS